MAERLSPSFDCSGTLETWVFEECCSVEEERHPGTGSRAGSENEGCLVKRFAVNHFEIGGGVEFEQFEWLALTYLRWGIETTVTTGGQPADSD